MGRRPKGEELVPKGTKQRAKAPPNLIRRPLKQPPMRPIKDADERKGRSNNGD